MVKKLFIILVILLTTITPVFADEELGTDFDTGVTPDQAQTSLYFSTSFEKPSVTDTSGYMTVLLKNKTTGTYYLRIFFWTIQNKTSANRVYMRIRHDNDTNANIYLTPIGESGTYYTLFCLKPLDDTLEMWGAGPINDDIKLYPNSQNSNLEVVSWQAFGNYLFYGTSPAVNTDINYTVTYGETNVYLKALQEGLVIDYDLIQQIVENEMQETEDSITDSTEEQTEEIGGFFGKLLEGIIEFFTGLFIPDDDFLNNWFTYIHNLFSDKLGILYAPFDLLITIVERFMSIESTEACMIIPNIKAPLYDVTLIPATNYCLTDIRQNENLRFAHDLYLTAVDVILWIMLLNLAYHKFMEVVAERGNE